jgi:hypothetical protein
MRVILTMVFLSIQLYAQGIGVEYGISGSENFGKPERTIGVTLAVRLNEYVLGTFSYANWNGEDGNLAYAKEHLNQAYNSFGFYGNTGLNYSLLYKYFNGNTIQIYGGLGFGQYENLSISLKKSIDSYYISAITVTPLYLQWKMSEKYSLYSRGMIGVKPNVIAPDWGSLLIGVMYNPF